LLLLAAFLFLPDLIFLFSLLFLVTAVFETILTTLIYEKVRKVFKSDKLLLNFLLSVKTVIVINPLQIAASNDLLIMGPGDMKSIQAIDFRSFYIKNKDIVQAKPSKNNKELLIHAKKMGKTKIYLTYEKPPKKGIKIVRIFIMSEPQKEALDTFSKIKSLNLSTDNGSLVLSGEISRYEDYKKLITNGENLVRVNKERLTLDTRLQRYLLSNLYNKLFERGLYTSFCKFNGLIIECDAWGNLHLDQNQKTYLRENFLFNINYVDQKKPRCAVISLYDLSSSDEYSIEQVEDFFSLNIKGINTFINSNEIKKSAFQNNIKLYHKIQFNFLPDKPYEFTIGETKKTMVTAGLFEQSINESYFSGININLKIKQSPLGLIAESKSKFSRSNEAIRRTIKNTSNSSTLILKNKPTIFFVYQGGLKAKSANGTLYFVKKFLKKMDPKKNQVSKLIKGVIQVNEQCKL